MSFYLLESYAFPGAAWSRTRHKHIHYFRPGSSMLPARGGLRPTACNIPRGGGSAAEAAAPMMGLNGKRVGPRNGGDWQLTACSGLRRGSCGGAAARLPAPGLVASGAWRASSMSGEGGGRAPQIYGGGGGLLMGAGPRNLPCSDKVLGKCLICCGRSPMQVWR
jgi:hypothetical protein